MPQHLIRKLERFTRLSANDKQALEAAAGQREHLVGPRQDIISEGDPPEHVNLILEGWACRYKQLEDGRRQIIAFFVPGDLFDIQAFALREMDHSIGTLTPVKLAEIHQDALLRLTGEHPRIARAFWWEALVGVAIVREWTVNLGQRIGLERVGHLLCEPFIRLRAVGLVEHNSCSLPLTQADLADATGLSNVHVNRVLQELRSSGLILLKDRRLTIPEMSALQVVSLFNPNYLHLDHEGRYFDADQG